MMLAVLTALAVALGTAYLSLRVLAQWFQQKGWTLVPAGQVRRRPAIGGILLAVSVLAALLVGLATAALGRNLSGNVSVVGTGVIFALALFVLGFSDDYLQAVRRFETGMPRLQRLVMEGGVVLCFLATAGASGHLSTRADVPFLGLLELSYAYYPLLFFLLMLFAESARKMGTQPRTVGPWLCGSAFGLALGGWMLAQTASCILAAALLGAGALLWAGEAQGFTAPTEGASFFGAGILIAAALGMDFPLVLVLLLAVPVLLWGLLAAQARGKHPLDGWRSQTPQLLQDGVFFALCVLFGLLAAFACSLVWNG